MTDDRERLLRDYGRYYGAEHFAVTFTAGVSGDDAKRVVSKGWDKTAPLADAEYAAGLVAGRGQKRNVAIVLRPSNLIVLECDSEEDLVRIEGLNLPRTLTVRSSKPYKRHYYYRPDPSMSHLPYVAFRFESGKLTADTGRYFLAPPSIHPTGAVYSFLPDLGPGEIPIAHLPASVYNELAARARVETSELRDAIATDPDAKIRAGNRRDAIFRYACMLRRWGRPRQAILEECLRFNQERCDPPVDTHLVEVQVDGAMKKTGEQELAAYGAPATATSTGGWQRIDLTDPSYAIPPDPPSILGLLYTRKRHVISGAPESSKTLVSYIALLEVVRRGHNVAVIDFEMGPHAARRLLDDLGATLDEIRRIYFVNPDAPPEDELQSVVSHDTQLALLDASAGAYDVSGLDDNKRGDAERFARTWIRPLWTAGITTLVLDHVVKNTEQRGKFTIGSERKVGQTDIHLGLEAVKPLSRGSTGIIKVHVHKDRPGFLQRPHAAIFELASDPDTHRIGWTIRPASETDETGEFRPTALMEKVSRMLETAGGEEFSRNDVEERVTGKRDYIRKALDILTREGYIAEQKGARGARLVTSVKAYRRPSDDFAPTSPHLARGEVMATSPHLAPPLQGDEVRGEVSPEKGEHPARPSQQGEFDYDHDIPF